MRSFTTIRKNAGLFCGCFFAHVGRIENLKDGNDLKAFWSFKGFCWTPDSSYLEPTTLDGAVQNLPRYSGVFGYVGGIK